MSEEHRRASSILEGEITKMVAQDCANICRKVAKEWEVHPAIPGPSTKAANDCANRIEAKYKLKGE